MKRMFLTAALIFLCGLQAKAADVTQTSTGDITITAKQGFVIDYKDGTLKNLTTFETVKTRKIDSWGKWNALWAGWSIDAGFAFDAQGVNDAALLLGRNFGTIGDYLPFDFPLKDKIVATLYPAGLYVRDIQSHKRKFDPCGGGAIIKLEVTF